MKLTDRILLEENIIIPNRYVSVTILFAALAVGLVEIINELGIFYVNLSAMRTVTVLAALLVLMAYCLAYWKKTCTKSWSRYVMMGLVLLVIYVLVVILDQFASLVVLLPIMLAAQYHDKKITLFTIVVTCVIALTSASLSCTLGFWQENFAEYELNAIGIEAGNLTAITDYDRMQYFWELMKYIGLPRLLITIIFSTVSFSVTYSGYKNLEDRIHATYVSQMDFLTGLYNRISFEEKSDEYRKHPVKNLLCVYCDADQLHVINNTKGHEVGDELLRSCAEGLQKEFGDGCYRVGGDEFIVLAENITEDESREKMKAVCETLGKKEFHMSWGVCTNEEMPNLDSMVRRAEGRMFEAKQEYYKSIHQENRSNMTVIL